MKQEKIFTKKDLKAFGDFSFKQGKLQAEEKKRDKVREQVTEEFLEWINVYIEKALWEQLFQTGKGYNAGAYIILSKLKERLYKLKGGIKKK